MSPPAPRLARRTARLHSSPIRELLSAIDRPGMISFAGGLPAAETFPDIRLSSVPQAWLQYGSSEGEPALRERIAADLRGAGLSCTAEQVLVLSGSQQGIDLVAKLFVEEDTPVAVESPTYLAALQVLRLFGARLQAFDPAAPMTSWQREGAPALAYVIPTFQNPTGRCLDATQRQSLARACDALGVPLFEDDPYRDLVYDPCERKPVCALLGRAPWVYQGSFSKSLAPGLRLGFLAASPELMPLLQRLKQAADLHSSRVSQWLVLEALESPERPARLERLVQTYRAKRDAFERCLERHLGALATWQAPPGGLFFWLELGRAVDTRGLLPLAMERKLAFMPGELFFPVPSPPLGRLRLNFSHSSPEQMDRGLALLAELIAQA